MLRWEKSISEVVLWSRQYSKKKGFAEDLSEGKFSFPIIHGIHANPSNRLILGASPQYISHTSIHSNFLSPDILEQRPSSPEPKLPVIEYLKNDTKSFVYTQSVLNTLEEQTRREIKRLGGNKAVEMIMDLLHVDVLKDS